MRWRWVAALILAACSAARPPAPLPHPAAAPGTVEVVARALEPVGDLRVVEVAVTSEHPGRLVLDRRQVFARIEGATAGAPPLRIAPLSPAEAARRAGGESVPASAAWSAAEGGVRGAATGAVTGGGAGGAVGAAVGAISGIFRGAQPEPDDVAGFEDRALPSTELRAGISVGGFVYFPAGDYSTLEVVLLGEQEVVRTIVPIAPAPRID